MWDYGTEACRNACERGLPKFEDRPRDCGVSDCNGPSVYVCNGLVEARVVLRIRGDSEEIENLLWALAVALS